MNWGAFALDDVLLLTVTVTPTVPAACAGAVAVQVVSEEQVTWLDGVDPKLTDVLPAVVSKPVPVIVTLVPPDVEPVAGDKAVAVGGP